MDKSSNRWGASRKAAFVAVGLLAGLLAFYAAVILWALGSPSLQDAVGRWVYDAVVLGAALVVLWRAATVEGERRAWLALGLGLLLTRFASRAFALLNGGRALA